MSEKIINKYIGQEYAQICVYMTVFSGICLTALLSMTLFKWCNKPKDPSVDEIKVIYEEQVADISYEVPKSPPIIIEDTHIVEDDSSIDIWIKRDEMTSEHVTPQILSSKNTTNLAEMVEKATCFMTLCFNDSDNDLSISRCQALNIYGRVFITAAHAFKPFLGKATMTLFMNKSTTTNGHNVDLNLKPQCLIAYKDVYLDKTNDIAVFQCHTCPLGKDLRAYFPKLNVFGSLSGHYICRQEDGDSYNIGLSGLHISTLTENGPKHYKAISSRKTLKGESGAPLICKTQAYGSCIIGLHVALQINLTTDEPLFTCAIAITQKILLNLVKSYQNQVCETVSQNSCGKILLTDGIVTEKIHQEIHEKSPLNYIENGTGLYIGSFTSSRSKPRSSVCSTHFTKYLIDHGYENKWAAPYMGGHPYSLALLDKIRPNMLFDRDILNVCADSFSKHVLSNLETKYLELVSSPLSLKQSLLGIPGVKFINRMEFKTSTGFPLRKCKRAVLVGEDDNMTLCDEYMDLFYYYLNEYKQGRRCNPVFNDSLKDEAKEHQKVLDRKTRVFSAAPFVWCIIVRMYLLPFIKLVQSNNFLFECMVGMDATSHQWHKLFIHLTKFGKHKMFAGDYGKYDKRMGAIVIFAAFRFICNILRAAGCSSEHINIVMLICEDVSFSFSNFNGDFIMWLGGNPSGWPLTVIVNSIVNSLYARYFYYEENPSHEVDSFSKLVVFVSLGDDNAVNVSDECTWFDHTVFQKRAALVGVDYTMADKCSASVPFLHIDEIDFLKRKFVYEEEHGYYVSRLSQDSIIRSLMCCVPSKTISQADRDIDALTSAMRELSFLARSDYEKRVVEFQEMLTNLNLLPTKYTFQSYDHHLEQYRKTIDDDFVII
jgi:hypothetical protein